MIIDQNYLEQKFENIYLLKAQTNHMPMEISTSCLEEEDLSTCKGWDGEIIYRRKDKKKNWQIN
jgi:hypothetical protein